MSTPNQHPIQKIVPYLHWAEKGFTLALFVGIILGYFKVDTLTLIKISLVALAVIFFLSAFKPIEIQHSEDEKFGFKDLLAFSIAPKVLWISCAVIALGILFYLQDNPGYKQQVFIGLSSNVVATFLILITFISGTKHVKVIAPILLRSVPLLLIGLFIFLK